MVHNSPDPHSKYISRNENYDSTKSYKVFIFNSLDGFLNRSVFSSTTVSSHTLFRWYWTWGEWETPNGPSDTHPPPAPRNETITLRAVFILDTTTVSRTVRSGPFTLHRVRGPCRRSLRIKYVFHFRVVLLARAESKRFSVYVYPERQEVLLDRQFPSALHKKGGLKATSAKSVDCDLELLAV